MAFLRLVAEFAAAELKLVEAEEQVQLLFACSAHSAVFVDALQVCEEQAGTFVWTKFDVFADLFYFVADFEHSAMIGELLAVTSEHFCFEECMNGQGGLDSLAFAAFGADFDNPVSSPAADFVFALNAAFAVG